MYGRSPSRPLSAGPHWPSRRRAPWQRGPFRPNRGLRLIAARPPAQAPLETLPAAA